MLRKQILNISIFILFLLSSATSMAANQFFRIGTGGVGGTYYPIGGLIANAISNPPGSRSCDKGGSCGVEGLIATALSSNGSVYNINAIMGGSMEAGFAQSDVIYWAYTATGLFKGKKPKSKLRLIASLYPESIHLVARKDANIKKVEDLKGKKVSLDEIGSGTLVDARIVLEAYGIDEKKDITPFYIKQSSEKLKDGILDAYISVAGYPKSAILDTIRSGKATLVPIAGKARDDIIKKYKFFSKDLIPASAYPGMDKDTETISVLAQFVTSSDIDEELIYEITKALWNKSTRALLDKGHAKAKMINPSTALDGIGIPLHAGAEKFYKEIGLLK